MSKPAHVRLGLSARLAMSIEEHDLATRDEAKVVVRIFVDPDLDGADQGDVAREDGEDARRHARRAAALDRLFGKGR